MWFKMYSNEVQGVKQCGSRCIVMRFKMYSNVVQNVNQCGSRCIAMWFKMYSKILFMFQVTFEYMTRELLWHGFAVSIGFNPFKTNGIVHKV